MKRYALFAFDCYYPGGGWNDFVEGFDTIDEAKTASQKSEADIKQIIDMETGKDCI